MSSPELEFSQLAGQLAESFSFNKSIGQIYGLLYITSHPLSLEEISQSLSMSKGNASINLRVLESWGAVHPIAVAGTRRDHYEANRNIKEVAFRRLQEGVGRRLDTLEVALDRVLSGLDPKKNGDSDGSFQKKKIEELRGLITKSRKAFDMMPKLLKVLDW
jgi:DNA-binding transcriptional regulator GbsR (MarR family)